MFYIVTVFRAFSTDSKGLAVMDGCLLVYGVTTGHVRTDVCLSVWCVDQICDNMVSSLYTQVSRKVISVGEIWEVNLIVTWC